MMKFSMLVVLTRKYPSILTFIIFLSILQISEAQKKGYTPKIEACDCVYKADSSLKTRCAYLIVPESRERPQGKTIKLPFIYIESANPAKKKDPVLFTGGGPGLSSLSPVRNIHRRSLIKKRDFIAFEQRGTRYAVPCLECSEISEELKMAYRKNLPKDSMILEGVKHCRKKLVASGIDLSAFNTYESAADIEDLRLALHIDSLNLLGISYSGGLLMTVLKNYPSGIRSLILDSPLPEYVNIDQEEIVNFNEALNTIFSKYEADFVNHNKGGDLRKAFGQYFSSIHGKVFTISYLEKGAKDSLKINYFSNELLGFLENPIADFSRIKDVPFIIKEMIKGNHKAYIKEFLDQIFDGGWTPNGMRLSVYCSDKMAYANKDIISDQYRVYPFMNGTGYFINSVDMPMCNCWNVTPVPAEIKMPFYSNSPALLAAGDTDAACRPIYNDLIHHYMPHSQRLLFKDRSHAPLLNTKEGDVFIGQFLDHPYKKIESENMDIKVY